MTGPRGTRAGRGRESTKEIVRQGSQFEGKHGAAVSAGVRAFFFHMPTEKTPMTQDDALKQLSHIARERAFDRHVGSDRLIQAGLDALIAGVESPSLAMLAGLLRSEEPDAPALFDQVLEELGLLFHPPADPRAAKWAMADWVAGQIADRTLDPALGTWLIWANIAEDLGYPEELEPLVHCAHNLDGWEESWGVSLDELNREAVEAAKHFLNKRSGAEAGS
ncbi:hypothetical protein GCM10010347_65100 [Streptomyces cirratus]|uniref:Uncharacterized protein n=2 Tax=Streptomyces cirratus TaxID=68187 RepID=A0ABQ3F5E0_9ACTN|nr:hypothetical protein GCM10010347_65100 [Streptomyces cirratus]